MYGQASFMLIKSELNHPNTSSTAVTEWGDTDKLLLAGNHSGPQGLGDWPFYDTKIAWKLITMDVGMKMFCYV